MELVFHGGQCCGIKIIHDLGCTPDVTIGPLSKVPVDDSDQYGKEVSSHQRFFHREAPAESRVERLKRYIEYCHERRPQGLIEITTADDTRAFVSQHLWNPILTELGFKVVSEFKNSNSERTVKVWHHIYDFGPDTSEDEESEIDECDDPDCPCHDE